MRQLTVETVYDETAGYNAMSSVSGTQTAALPSQASEWMPMPTRALPSQEYAVSPVILAAAQVGDNAGHRATQAVSVECLKGHLGRNTPMRLLILEIVDGEITGKRAAWSLSAATWARRWQSLVRRDTVDHCAEVLSTTKIERAHR